MLTNDVKRKLMTGMFQAIGRYPVAPLARIPEVSELGIKRILDAGAWGFVAPNVKTREEAQIVADYGQYPPKGRRSLGSGRFALSFKTDPKTYFERANEEILRVVQIEDIAAVKRIDEILSVPGIDACFIGPNDLCNSMGLAPSLDPPHKEYEEAIQAILRSARKHGVAPGVHTPTPEAVNRRLAEGWQGVIVGMVVSVASTMVLARLLLDRGELRSQHGRVMIGLTLVEDLAVVVLTILIPVLGTMEPGRLVALGAALGKAALILVPFALLAATVVPRVMSLVARMRNDEMLLLVALAVGLGTAALTQAVGLSLALGAFLAGLLISSSDYVHDTMARLLPLRDAFVALFFVTIGTLIDPRTVLANLPLLGVMLALIILGKLVIWTAVVWLFRYRLATALVVAVGLTQIGEFSFILVQAARSAGHVGADVYTATLAAALLSILLNAVLVRYVPSRRPPS